MLKTYIGFRMSVDNEIIIINSLMIDENCMTILDKPWDVI
jgi:hypothetical protein